MEAVFDPEFIADFFRLEGRGGARPRPSGNNMMARCPFPHIRNGSVHRDRNPSFGINIRTGAYHCFSCGKSGNSLYELAEALNLDAAEFPRVIYRQAFFQDDVCADAYMEKLIRMNGDTAAGYLRSRGVRNAEEVVRAAGIGASTDGKEVYFPLRSGTGEFTGWAVRYVGNSSMRWGMFPEGVKKNRLVFSFRNGNTHDKTVYISESVTDAVTAAGEGLNSAATLGASVSAYQTDAVSGYDTVVLLPQNDAAGKFWYNSAVRMLFRKTNLLTADIPENCKDLNEFAAGGGDVRSLKPRLVKLREYRSAARQKYES